MPLLCFSDVLRRAGIEPKKTMLIRNALSQAEFEQCYKLDKNNGNKELVFAYNCNQDVGFSDGMDYWAVFISDKGATCKFYGLYHVGGWVPDTPDLKPAQYPENSPSFKGNRAFYMLERDRRFEQYENRLVIDWGKSARTWYQKGTNEKEIIGIQSSKAFTNYDDIILDYCDLEDYVSDPMLHREWYDALSAVYAVYLIVDKKSGKQYVGSAYNEKEGLWGRWAYYVKTKHGGNKLIEALLAEDPERYKHFQFSILQILPKSIKAERVVQIENRFKKKLLSQEFGLNGN